LKISLDESTFWQYACELYIQPGVKESCLALQDNQQLNVNLLLLLCWCEQNQQQLSKSQIDALISAVSPWHQDYTQPLRQLRRQMSQQDAATSAAKRAMLDAELALEKIEQSLLLEMFNRFELIAVKKADNLTMYCDGADFAVLRQLMP